MSPRLAFALEAAFLAGRTTLKYFQTGAEVITKSDDSPVTAADKEAEELIRSMIEKKFPGEAILGEEFGGSDALSTRWVIDPIDGTKSFIAGVPLYATLLSFEIEGEPQLGVAYFPALDEMIYAEIGSGCTWNGRPCHVTTNSNLSKSILCCGGHASLSKTGGMPGIISLAERCRAMRTWCDAYGHCLVATGRVDAMIDPVVAPWDISAIRVIVREAGGKFTDFAGGESPLVQALSTNQALHSTILEALRR